MATAIRMTILKTNVALLLGDVEIVIHGVQVRADRNGTEIAYPLRRQARAM